MVPADSIRVSRVRIYSGTNGGVARVSPTGLLPSTVGYSYSVRLPARFVTPRPPCGATLLALQPRPRNARRLPRVSVWAKSPFARHYSGNRGFLSFPPGTQMCHFPGFPPPALCVQTGVTRHYPCRVSPFGNPCFKARLRLHTAYRSLPRPSSASGAKASAIRPYYLDDVEEFRAMQFSKNKRLALAGASTSKHRAKGPEN